MENVEKKARKPRQKKTWQTEVSALKKRVIAAEKQLKSAKKSTAAIMRDELDVLMADSKYLHDYLHILIRKVTTCTELAFYGRHHQTREMSVEINKAVIWSLDQPDEWWGRINDDRDTIKEVAYFVMSEYVESDRHKATLAN